MQMYSLFDHKTGEFEFPMAYLSEAVAKRAISSFLLDSAPNSVIRQFPNDFSLYLLGTYDRNGALFHILPSPQLVCNVSDLLSEVSHG